MDSVLPSDLDILSPPRVTQALCVQYRAKPSPTALDCARSFSWCGKTRSSPPPWMSNSGPRYMVAIAEHSRCQPGRPLPHGVGQDGSPGLTDFHMVKSCGSCLSAVLKPSDSPCCISSGRCPDSAP